MSVKAYWSGRYPCLCYGTWRLIVDGEDVSDMIPEDLRDKPMNTFGTYSTWYFNDWVEEFDSYEDGLTCEDWIRENDYWLSDITDNHETKEQIYYAINGEDFRTGSCGGCI